VVGDSKVVVTNGSMEHDTNVIFLSVGWFKRLVGLMMMR
jgi:hypothetical protein